MIFPTASVPTMPAFLIGRIQWDNWLLLQAIAEPTVTTIEVSEVVMALHLNHGGFKESHKKNGTEYNKQLAVYGNFGIIWDALIFTTLPALPHPTHAV